MRVDFRIAPRPNKYGIREIWSGPEVNYILNQDNELKRWNLSYTHWTSFSTNDSIMINLRSMFERLDEDFEIRDDVIIPIGNYRFSGISGRFFYE